MCDCCEDDRFAYEIDGVKMSDFALPSWFVPGSARAVDVPRTVRRALALADGGYIGVHQVAPVVTPVGNRVGPGRAGRRTVKGPWSRTMRRFTRGTV